MEFQSLDTEHAIPRAEFRIPGAVARSSGPAAGSSAAELYEGIEALLEHGSFPATRGYRNQIDRAALSV